MKRRMTVPAENNVCFWNQHFIGISADQIDGDWQSHLNSAKSTPFEVVGLHIAPRGKPRLFFRQIK
jgi:hypothetical protein